MDGGDPAERLLERSEEEDDFDWDAELAHFHKSGFVLPLPIVQRAERVAKLVKAGGWDCACALLDEEFRGWECDYLAVALPALV